jgi:hypothetical protein
VNCRFSLQAAGHGRRNPFQMGEAYFAAFFCLAQRFFCASEIRLLASALMRRRLPSCEPREVTDPAAVLLGDVPPSKAAIALSMRPLSAFKSWTIFSVSKSFPPSGLKSAIVAGTQREWSHAFT